MRKLVVALIAVVLAGTSLTLTAPAQADSLAWHTVLKNRKAKIQACKQPMGYNAYKKQTYYFVNWRVDNRRGSKIARLTVNVTDQGEWNYTGHIPLVWPHRKRGPIGYSPLYDTAVAQLSTKYGHHRKYGAVSVAAIGLC